MLATLAAITLAASACGGDDGSSGEAAQEPAPKQADAQLGGVKDYLLEHTEGLNAFTEEFDADSERYYELAKAADFDYARLWRTQGAEVGPLVQRLKTSWIEGNPTYERVEGIVAGTPSLSKYDVILDAGSSAAEDPESAVPFDLTLASGTVLEQPGNLYNLTEGALWGTLPEGLPASTAADLDGDGKSEFGEALPDANLLAAASEEFKRSAEQLHQSANEWQPSQFGRLHGPRRDGADDERVLRPVEGVAVRRRQPQPTPSPSTSSRACRTSTTSSRGSTSSTPA